MYGAVYRIYYRDKYETLCHVDILRRDYSGSCQDIDGSDDPFKIDFPQRATKYTPVCGTGAYISSIRETTQGLKDLYSNDILLHKVEAYRGSHCWWKGYVNTEVYSQNLGYSVDKIQITANDGLALLERMPFKDENGAIYTGLKLVWDVIKIIFDKLGLDFEKIYLSLNKYEKRMNTLTSPLHQLQVDCRNYYDEQGDAMSCREVLEEILKPFGVTLFWHDGNLVILDVDELKNQNIEFRVYDNTYAYLNNITINNFIDINSMEWDWTPQLDILAGFNKQVIKYSPYPVQNLFPEIDFNNESTWVGDNIEWVYNSTYRYYELTNITGFMGLTLLGDASIDGRKESEYDDNPDIYIKTPPNTTGAFLKSNVNENLICSTNNTQGIVLTIPVYIKLKEGKTTVLNKIRMRLKINVGMNHNVDWNSVPYYSEAVIESPESNIANTWSYFKIIVPNDCFSNGYLSYLLSGEFIIYEGHYIITDGKKVYSYLRYEGDDIEEIRFKEPRTELNNLIQRRGSRGYYWVASDSDAEQINDIEYVGEMDEKWLNAGEPIELRHGDSWNGNISDRGGFHLLNGEFTGEWKRPEDTLYYSLPELLLKSVISNYHKAMDCIRGKGTAENIMNGAGVNFNGILSFLSILTDGTKKYMWMGGTYHDRDMIIDGSWIELLENDLTILK